MTPFTDSTECLGNPEALRANARRDGYLFIRNLLPREPVQELRTHILQILDGEGYLDRDHPLDAAVVDQKAVEAIPTAEDNYCGGGVPEHVYRAVQTLESFHRLPHHPNLLNLYRDLYGEEVLVHPRHICRLMVPSSKLSPTPPHQDHVHVQGTAKTWTCWFPLGDCPVDLGSLAVLRGSHTHGVLPVKPAEGAGGLASWLCDFEDDWQANDFRAGDIITFPSYCVHKSLPNQQMRHVRLSFDARFQPLSEPVQERSLKPHCEVAPWDDIYADWQEDDLKYYWRQHDLNVAEWDESIMRIREDIC